MQNSNTSILKDAKKMLGIEPDYEAFDDEICMHISSIMMTLNQLGVGPPQGFSIFGDEETWSDFLGGSRKDLAAIKSYTFLRLRLLFDPPANSFLVTSIQAQVDQLEWRLNVQVETPALEVDYRA